MLILAGLLCYTRCFCYHFCSLLTGGAVERGGSLGLSIYWTYGIVWFLASYCMEIVGIQTDHGGSQERGEGVPGAYARLLVFRIISLVDLQARAFVTGRGWALDSSTR